MQEAGPRLWHFTHQAAVSKVRLWHFTHQAAVSKVLEPGDCILIYDSDILHTKLLSQRYDSDILHTKLLSQRY